MQACTTPLIRFGLASSLFGESKTMNRPLARIARALSMGIKLSKYCSILFLCLFFLLDCIIHISTTLSSISLRYLRFHEPFQSVILPKVYTKRKLLDHPRRICGITCNVDRILRANFQSALCAVAFSPIG